MNGFCCCTFQNRFDNLFRKYITYTGGEELFGLPVTQHPQLLDIKKQLALLQKLYGLYNNVIETVNGYYDILWSEINIERVNNELLDFQTRLEIVFVIFVLKSNRNNLELNSFRLVCCSEVKWVFQSNYDLIPKLPTISNMLLSIVPHSVLLCSYS